MDSSPQDHENSNYNGQPSDSFLSPLLRPMSAPSMGSLCTFLVVFALASGWCILDYWNRQITTDLFNIGDIRMMDMDKDGVPEVISPFTKFVYPLTLAFLQFVFMGVFFLVLHFAVNQERPQDLKNLRLTSDKRWGVMLVTHVFSIFWLQSLMMPAQVLSLGLFAASRAVEIPIAAALRWPVLGHRYGRKAPLTIGLAFVAAMIMFYAYAQVAGCLCVWSGHGVSLSGIAFWLVYLMLLAMPAANAVCQEGIMVTPGMHPLLLLALQNVFACFVFGPILLLAHLVGWEDVSGAFEMILTFDEVFMLVVWLCAQIAVTSVLSITLIHLVDSFWTLVLRCLRVAFAAISLLLYFYMSGPGLPVSIACPRSSLWAFVLVCGGMLMAASAISDRVARPEDQQQESNDKNAPSAPAVAAATTKSVSSGSNGP
jgi:hypothetical protein